MATDDPKDSEKPQKRRFQFTLGRMFWAMTLLCMLAFVVSEVVHTKNVELFPWWFLGFELFGASVGALAGGFTGAVKGIVLSAIAILLLMPVGSGWTVLCMQGIVLVAIVIVHTRRRSP
jgi:hypothetical protein